MNLGIKSITLRFDDNQLGYLQPVQGDTKSRGFLVEMVSTDGEVLDASTTYECRLYGVNSNYPDKTFYTVATVEEGRYKLYLSTDMVSKAGTLKLQVALYKGAEELIQSEVKEVEVSESMANGGNLGKDLVVDFTKLEKALERVDTQEKAYKDSLQKQEVIKSDIDKKQKQVSTDTTAVKKIRTDMEGVMAAEASRVNAEKTRQSQESTRQSQEGIRENKFKEAEANRSKVFEEKENLRQSEETKRQSQESTRQSQESTRKSQEAQRVEAEKKRVSAETSRASAESTRSSQETTRQSEEGKRKSNENSRVSAEDTRKLQETTRQNQETARVEAEKKRKSTFEGWDKTMQGVIPNGTQTRAGVVKVLHSDRDDKEGPYTVPSMGIFDENFTGFIKILNNKADKSHTHNIVSLEGWNIVETQFSTMQGEIGSFRGEVSNQLFNYEEEMAKELNKKADKKHKHACIDIENPVCDEQFFTSNLDDYLANLQHLILRNMNDLFNKISFTGQIPFKNAQIIEKGGSTAGIPNETMIYELE